MKKKSLKLNATLNVIRQCCAILFPMITIPYVSRVLGVEAYGEAGYATSIVSYFSLIAGLGVNSYAIREGARIRDDKRKLETFASEVFSINLISTIVAYLLFGALILLWGDLEPYRIILVIMSLNILFITLGMDWINTLYEDFAYLTFRYIICQSIAVVATLVLVKRPEDVWIYALCINLGTMLANAWNIYYIRCKMGINVRCTLKLNAAKHMKPIMLLFGNMVSATIYLYSDSTMLGAMLGNLAVGYYTVASKIYMLVKQLINAISNVIVPRISHNIANSDNASLSNSLDKILGLLSLIVFPIAMGMIGTGEEIITIIAGKDYIEAYMALAILSVSLILATFACIFVSVFMLALRKDKEILIASAISALVNVGLNFVMIPRFGFVAAAWTTLVSEFIICSFGIYHTRSIIKLHLSKQAILGLLGSVEVFVICYFVKQWFSNAFLVLPLCVLLCAIVYGATLILSGAYKDFKNV